MEEVTNPAPEVAEPPVEDRIAALLGEDDGEPEAPEVDEPEDAESVEEDQDEAPAEPDSEEIEFAGKKAVVPKEIAEVVKKADSLQKDYTQKTQAAAELYRIAHDKLQFAEAQQVLQGAAFNEAAQLQSLQSQLQQFDQLDWTSLYDTDPAQAAKLTHARQQLQSRVQDQASKVQQIVAQQQQAMNMHLEQQMAMGRQELERRVGKLGDEDRQATWKQGLDLGFTPEELSRVTDPRLMHALFKAARWDALQAAKPAVQKKVANAKPMQAPAARTAQTSIEQSKRDNLRQTLRKTGRTEVAEDYIASLFERNRKR